MKKLDKKIWNHGLVVVMFIALIFTGCEEELYEATGTPIDLEELGLVYESSEFYNSPENLFLPTPVFNPLNVNYKWVVDTVAGPLGFVRTQDNVSVDILTGQVRLGNQNNSIIAGEYGIVLAMQTAEGQFALNDTLWTSILNIGAIEFDYEVSTGSDLLERVITSRNLGFSTKGPIVNGIDPVSLEVYAVSGTDTLSSDIVAIDTDGVVSVASDQNIPVGVYNVSARLEVASGQKLLFPGLFDIDVTDVVWEEVLDENWATGGSVAVPDITLVNDVDDQEHSWQRKWVNDGSIWGYRVQTDATASGFDVFLLKRIDNSAGESQYRVTFKEKQGYNDLWFFADSDGLGNWNGNRYRELRMGYDKSNLETNLTFTPTEWPEVIGNESDTWPYHHNWDASLAQSTDGFREIVTIIDVAPSESDVFLNWRLYDIGQATGGVYVLGGLKLERNIGELTEIEEVAK